MNCTIGDDTLSQLTQLRYLSIGGNKTLTDVGIVSLINLEFLIIMGDDLIRGEDERFQNLSRLEYLQLFTKSNFRLSCIKKLTNLKSLSIGMSDWNGRDEEEFCSDPFFLSLCQEDEKYFDFYTLSIVVFSSGKPYLL